MKILVVYKKSVYQLYVEEYREADVSKAAQTKDPAVARLLRSHGRQAKALARVEKSLSKLGVEFDIRWRGQIRSPRGYDLILTVGGDGTILDAGRWIQNEIPLLGINSDPRSSVGMLCGGTADELPHLLELIEQGWRPRKLARVRVTIDGKQAFAPCLNEVLFAHSCPAEMSRFEITLADAAKANKIGPRSRAVQWHAIRSSGIWISTATGSTAAIRSAGGKVMAPTSRRLQYLVREPYSGGFVQPTIAHRGFVKEGTCLVLINRMRTARIWGDGPHHRCIVRYGQRVVIDSGAPALNLYHRDYR